MCGRHPGTPGRVGGPGTSLGVWPPPRRAGRAGAAASHHVLHVPVGSPLSPRTLGAGGPHGQAAWALLPGVPWPVFKLARRGRPLTAAVPCGQRGLVTAEADCRLAPDVVAGRRTRCLRGALLPAARLWFGLLVAGASRPRGASALTATSTYSASGLLQFPRNGFCHDLCVTPLCPASPQPCALPPGWPCSALPCPSCGSRGPARVCSHVALSCGC